MCSGELLGLGWIFCISSRDEKPTDCPGSQGLDLLLVSGAGESSCRNPVHPKVEIPDGRG